MSTNRYRWESPEYRGEDLFGYVTPDKVDLALAALKLYSESEKK